MIMTEVTESTTKHPGGRPKGSPNASTLDARRAIAAFVEGNVDRLNGWLDEIAETNPLAAFDRFMSVVEYHVPRLARQEITGKDGERLQINVVTGVQAIDAEFVEVGAAALPAPCGSSVPDAILQSGDVVAVDAAIVDHKAKRDDSLPMCDGLQSGGKQE